MPGFPTVWIALAALALFVCAMALLRVLAPRLEALIGSARTAGYLLMTLRAWMLFALVVSTIWYLDQASGQNNLFEAMEDTGFNLRPGFQGGMVASVWMFVECWCVSALVLQLRRQFGGAATTQALALLPQSTSELVVWALVLAPTAAIVEELVYRGFLLGQLWGLVQVSWGAAALSSLLFGLVHSYQGPWGVVRTGAIGFVLSVGVVATGSIVPSILAHLALNAGGVAFNAPVKGG